MEIALLNQNNIKDMNRANEEFLIIGKIIPKLENNEWTYKEVLYEKATTKKYPNHNEDFNVYLNNENKAAFLAYEDGKCIGQILLRKEWNLYAFVEDLVISKEARGKGVGTNLMNQAVEWAKDSDWKGLSLETQDNNLLACRFYQKYGMKIGAVNTMFYKNLGKPWSDEAAVFWYLKF